MERLESFSSKLLLMRRLPATYRACLDEVVRRNAFADKGLSDNYKKGEDALVDALLLSCANFIIKPASALSEFSVYFNPDLHNHTLELQYEVGGPSADEAFAAHVASARDGARGFARCAPMMRGAPAG